MAHTHLKKVASKSVKSSSKSKKLAAKPANKGVKKVKNK